MKLFQQENCLEVITKLFAVLKIKVTATTLEKDLTFHPDYPSLLSISDTLIKYGVDNVAIKTQPGKLRQIPLPCLVQIKSVKDNDDFFSVIKSINHSYVTYYDPDKKLWKKSSLADFTKVWPKGIALIMDATFAHGEKDYLKNRREENQRNTSQCFTLLALPLLAIFFMVTALINNGLSVLMPALYLLLTLLGILMTGLLVGYELNPDHAVAKKFCTAHKKVNCAAVLSSRASKVFGIPWSTIGLLYFIMCLFVQLIIGFANPIALFVLTWISTIAISFVFFSVYYQWRIVKQWCILCLGVQAVLVLQLFIAVVNNWQLLMPWSAVLPITGLVLLASITAFTLVNLLSITLRAEPENKRNLAAMQRLKHHPQLFEALLEKQKMMISDPAGLGIVLGNPQGSCKIIKVCNPYCAPSASAHPAIEELLDSNPQLQVQIIFTAIRTDNDVTALTIKHLLAIAENHSETLIKNALDYWYLSPAKDYQMLATKFMMNGELKKQGTHVEAMYLWCKNNHIIYTPTFFVNGYQLPEIYNIDDLRYLIPFLTH